MARQVSSSTAGPPAPLGSTRAWGSSAYPLPAAPLDANGSRHRTRHPPLPVQQTKKPSLCLLGLSGEDGVLRNLTGRVATAVGLPTAHLEPLSVRARRQCHELSPIMLAPITSDRD